VTTNVPEQGATMHHNLAARAGRWSASHFKTAFLGWLAFVAAAVALGAIVGTRQLTDTENAQGESARAEQMLAQAGFKDVAGESVLVQSRRGTATAPGFRRALDDVVGALEARPQVARVRPPVISRDRRSALVQFDLSGPAATADARVQPVLDTVGAAQRRHPALTIEEFGMASAARAMQQTTGRDLSNAERLSLPITFAILLLAFGAMVAAGLPVLLGFSAVLASLGISSLLSHLQHASDATSSVILLIGMAVGVDYSLFYVKREREERAAGRGPADALQRAAATSGRAVLVSGATVMIAMAGMLLAGSNVFTSIGIGAMVVVFVSMLGSLTVLPALLGRLGDRIDRGLVATLAAGLSRLRLLVRLSERRTLLQRLKGERGESRLWAAVLRPSLRHPAAATALSAAALAVLALPALGMQTKLLGLSDYPSSLHVVQAYETIQHAFPGSSTPAVVVVEAPDVTAPPVRAALAALDREALASGSMQPPIRTAVSRDHTTAKVEIPLLGNGSDARSRAALGVLRGHVVPATVGRLRGAHVAVGGEAAGNADFGASVRDRAPLVFAFVLGLAFLLLLLTFRSLVIPLQAIVLNLLSVGAAYGVLTWIFQDGHLQGLLGFHSNGAIVTWLPLFLFTVLFGLSMDYHVFILSRVKELVDGGLSTGEAVERGIRATAGTVTSAALVMVAVFSIFATLSTLDIKQLGVGLAIAVILDATVVRGVLLPASTKLLGSATWYLPRSLEWLPRVALQAPRGDRAAQAG
jgi:RND superfamily putative drug exporter